MFFPHQRMADHRARATRSARGTKEATRGRSAQCIAGYDGRANPHNPRAIRNAASGFPLRVSSEIDLGSPSKMSSPPLPVRTTSAPSSRALLIISRTINPFTKVKGDLSTPRSAERLRAHSSGVTRLTRQLSRSSKRRMYGRSSPGPSKSKATAKTSTSGAPTARATANTTAESTPPLASTATRRAEPMACSTLLVTTPRTASRAAPIVGGVPGFGAVFVCELFRRTPENTVCPTSRVGRERQRAASADRQKGGASSSRRREASDAAELLPY